jgi:hypothetical protein
MPEKTKDTEKTEEEKLLQHFAQLNFESEENLSAYKARWVKNTKLVKGIFPPNETTLSKVRKRSKIFFRKIYATKWRVIAAFYQAFLRDINKFSIKGEDELDDPRRARVLEKIAKVRVKQMYRKDDLFIQFIHGYADIFDFGLTTGKMTWNKKEKRPKFILYPPERVKHDMTATTPARRKFVIFVDYLTKEEIKTEYGDDIEVDKLKPTSVPTEDPLRASRFEQQRDPLNLTPENGYPSPDKLTTQEKQSFRDLYEVWEVFERVDGKIKFTVTHESELVLKETIDSPFGNEYFPDVTGMCLLEAHKLIGEGFPESHEGPQESFNHILNMRKDELALSLAPMNLVNKWANVDLQSLTKVRPGGIVGADSTDDAVTQLKMGNVTQSAYIEAAQDEAMMEELSGVVPPLQGVQDANTKATTAQLNASNANIKLDLFLAIVAETFMKNFYHMVIHLEQLFETDKEIFRIANEPLRVEGVLSVFEEDIQDIDDFEIDFTLEVAPDKVSQQAQIGQLNAAIQNMIMSNQSTIGMMSIPGAVPPEGVEIFSIPQVMKELLPIMGVKNYKDFVIRSGQPVPQEGGKGAAGNAIQGSLAPQRATLPQGMV